MAIAGAEAASRFVTRFADARPRAAFSWPALRGTAMNAGMPTRTDRTERILGTTLAIVLLAAVVWALTRHGTAPGIDLHALLG
jgi:hypothetical protein